MLVVSKAFATRVLKAIKKLNNSVPLIFLGVVAFLLGNFTGTLLLSLKSKVDIENLFSKRDSSEVQTSSLTQNSKIIVDGREISIPPQEASDTEKGKFSLALSEVAKVTDEMEVGDCNNLSPKVVKVKENSNFTFTNKSNQNRRITIYKEEMIVPSQENKSIALNLKAGIYGVRCDSIVASGFIMLEAN